MIQELSELISLTKELLKEDYQSHEWIETNKESHQFFRDLALNSKPRLSKPAAQVKSLKPVKPIIRNKVETPKKVEPQEKPAPPKPASQKQELKEEKVDLSPQLKLIREVCPSLAIIEEIPPPAGPKKVMIIAPDTDFWPKVAKALTDRGIDVEITEQCDDPDCRLLLIPRKRLSEFETVKIPIILTEEVPLYESDPYLKRVLWQALREKLRI